MKTGPRPGEPVVQLSVGAIRKTPPRDLAIRFAFGAGISTVAGVIGIIFGSRVGGILLAFPAILPATLTLLEKEDTERRAMGDDVGSILGAVALVAFALVAWTLFSKVGTPLSLVAACAAWFVVAAGLYLIARALALRSEKRVSPR